MTVDEAKRMCVEAREAYDKTWVALVAAEDAYDEAARTYMAAEKAYTEAQEEEEGQ
jgi:hypothetical protein